MCRNWEGHQWALPNVTALRELMRYTYTHREDVASKGERARRDMIENFSLQKIGNELKAEFERIKSILEGNDNNIKTTRLPDHVDL